ncbi:zinc finger CCHC domain-containing protein 8 homolog [Eurosta solidaginis]|uniref:zinc finger CCHC domain-containing protein 8 homolog n=1 Tax=Eurosta solidaginis TaxID=178769 RepID=UPI003530E3A5
MMDTSVDVIKLDSDNDEADEHKRLNSTVDLTSDTSFIDESVLPMSPAPVAEIMQIIANEVVEIEDGEVEEAEEATELCDGLLPNNETPAFEVRFANKATFKQYAHTVLDSLNKSLNHNVDGIALRTAFKFNIVDDKENNFHIKAFIVGGKVAEAQLSDCEEVSIPNVVTTVAESSLSHELEISSITDAVVEREVLLERDSSPDINLSALFRIDTSGSKKLDTQRVPSYKRSVKDVLKEESSETKRRKTEKDDNECPRVRSSVACFNCGVGGHSLRDCPKPRNNARINRAKLARKQERYHIDIEQRFGHFRPGVISDKLQAALGLNRGEIPFFFYRMRKLGYPPAWLEEAKVVHSGISLFNSEGNDVMASEEENSQESVEQKYDISKLVDFPGFNVDPGPNFYDDYKHHNVPPFSRYQRKEEFIKQLGANVIKGYKHKKLRSLPQTTNAIENKESILDTADMEIEDDNAVERNVIFTRPPLPPEPADDLKPAPPPPPPPETEPPSPPSAKNIANMVAEHERTDSPTLDDLEERKQKLLAELKAGLSEADLSQSTISIDTILLETSGDELNADEIPKQPAATSQDECESEPTTPTTNGITRPLDVIKESHMGTPVLQFSPYDKLPAGENFKVGVSDVINFENLPDSTGKYEQMKEVIKKVRDIVTKLHNDDDD